VVLVVRSFYFYGHAETIFIALAGLAGTLIRYWLAGFVTRQYGENFPWGTLMVNLIGSFLAGALYHLAEDVHLIARRPIRPGDSQRRSL
jgi:fluoride ion exporter CrcB/FEX